MLEYDVDNAKGVSDDPQMLEYDSEIDTQACTAIDMLIAHSCSDEARRTSSKTADGDHVGDLYGDRIVGGLLALCCRPTAGLQAITM